MIVFTRPSAVRFTSFLKIRRGGLARNAQMKNARPSAVRNGRLFQATWSLRLNCAGRLGRFLLCQRLGQTGHCAVTVQIFNRCKFAGHTVQRAFIQLTLGLGLIGLVIATV